MIFTACLAGECAQALAAVCMAITRLPTWYRRIMQAMNDRRAAGQYLRCDLQKTFVRTARCIGDKTLLCHIISLA